MSLLQRWFIVKLNQFVQIVDKRYVEAVMVAKKREKRKMSFDDLERHVINWAVDQLDSLRECVYEIEDDVTISYDKRFILYANMAKAVDDLLSLLNPMRHDADCLMEWGFNFVDEHSRISYANKSSN